MKKIKVFQDDVYLRDIYPHATRWQVLKFKVAQWIGHKVRIALRILKLSAAVSAAMLVGAFIYGFYFGSQTLIVNASSPFGSSTLTSKIDDLKNQFVDSVSERENINKVPFHIDNNKAKTLKEKDIPSFGCMQFKVSTIESYSLSLNKEKLTDTDAIILGLDCDKSKALAKQIIFDTTGGLWNWSVATQADGVRVDIIKQLSK